MGTVWTRGAGGVGQLGTREEVTQPEYAWINDKRTNLHTLNKTCWPARSPHSLYCSIWLSLGSGVIQCNRYALQNYLSTAQQLYKQGRKTPLEYLKSSTGSFKPLANASGWHLILCIKKEIVNWNATSFLIRQYLALIVIVKNYFHLNYAIVAQGTKKGKDLLLNAKSYFILLFKELTE